MSTHLTAAELARKADAPISRVLRMIETGKLVADGSCQDGRQILFTATRLPELRAVIAAAAPAPRAQLSLINP